MKYQLADLNNGPFGDVYETLADAEKALAAEIKEGQAFNNSYAQECADAGREVPSAADFFSIVEVEDEVAKVFALEDNGGGLHIAVVNGGACEHFFSGFEFAGDRAPTMQEEIESAAKDGVIGWDGDAENPQESYDYWQASEYAYKVIGEWDGEKVVVHAGAMGNAGHRWSRTSYDD